MICMYIKILFYNKKGSKYILKYLYKSLRYVEYEIKFEVKVSMYWMYFGF